MSASDRCFLEMEGNFENFRGTIGSGFGTQLLLIMCLALKGLKKVSAILLLCCRVAEPYLYAAYWEACVAGYVFT